MPDIDHAMRPDVPRSEIFEILSTSGLKMTMSFFDVSRCRIKKLSSASSSKSDSTFVGNNNRAHIASSI
jgi:hypothetical protein